MICTSCGKSEAVVLVKQLVDNQLSQAALCAPCAGQLPPELDVESSLLKLLSGLTGRRAAPPCPACQTGYEDFKETGRFGCPTCYDHFAPMMRAILPRIHGGAIQHRGKVPRK